MLSKGGPSYPTITRKPLPMPDPSGQYGNSLTTNFGPRPAPRDDRASSTPQVSTPAPRDDRAPASTGQRAIDTPRSSTPPPSSTGTRASVGGFGSSLAAGANPRAAMASQDDRGMRASLPPPPMMPQGLRVPENPFARDDRAPSQAPQGPIAPTGGFRAPQGFLPPPPQAPQVPPAPQQTGTARVLKAGKGWTEYQDSQGNIIRRVGARNWRNNNPGNIEYGPFSKKQGAIGTDGRFAVFPDYDTGRKAKESLLFSTDGYKNKSIRQAISRYAPSFENDTNGYMREVASAIGVSPDVPLSSLNPQQRVKMLDAMERVEGFKVGQETRRGAKGTSDIKSAYLPPAEDQLPSLPPPIPPPVNSQVASNNEGTLKSRVTPDGRLETYVDNGGTKDTSRIPQTSQSPQRITKDTSRVPQSLPPPQNSYGVAGGFGMLPYGSSPMEAGATQLAQDYIGGPDDGLTGYGQRAEPQVADRLPAPQELPQPLPPRSVPQDTYSPQEVQKVAEVAEKAPNFFQRVLADLQKNRGRDSTSSSGIRASDNYMQQAASDDYFNPLEGLSGDAAVRMMLSYLAKGKDPFSKQKKSKTT